MAFVIVCLDLWHQISLNVQVPIYNIHIRAALCKKVPNSLSRYHTKRRTGARIMLKERRARPLAPVLLLVWQRLRTSGTFSRDAANIQWAMFQRKSFEIDQTLAWWNLCMFAFVNMHVLVMNSGITIKWEHLWWVMLCNYSNVTQYISIRDEEAVQLQVPSILPVSLKI